MAVQVYFYSKFRVIQFNIIHLFVGKRIAPFFSVLAFRFYE